VRAKPRRGINLEKAVLNKRFGHLQVVSIVIVTDKRGKSRRKAKCKCQCGEIKEVNISELRQR
jgi:HJR/Mrr/RecB family endonuclease